ncbi:MAG: DUF3226 domain-containing protein [Candidatus Parabeggiatoa sp.]|nr:DUF3226 domain-containing protein [Candidatus Parabeggiatoa sp.]
MQNNAILLFVEGQTDSQKISWILEAADYPLERISIHLLQGKMNAIHFTRHFPDLIKEKCAILVDLDERGSIPQAIQRIKEQLQNPPINHIFCAIPTIEAWLFADDDMAIQKAQGELEHQIVSALPLPEEIENPFEIAQIVFKKVTKTDISSWAFMKEINIERACARAPSLRHFLTGLNQLLELNLPSISESVPRSLNREVFVGLLREIVPANTIMWKTSAGHLLTAKQLREEIEQGTELGRQYAADILRIARDLIKGMAQRGENV